jgi:hypothetical protein
MDRSAEQKFCDYVPCPAPTHTRTPAELAAGIEDQTAKIATAAKMREIK